MLVVVNFDIDEPRVRLDKVVAAQLLGPVFLDAQDLFFARDSIQRAAKSGGVDGFCIHFSHMLVGAMHLQAPVDCVVAEAALCQQVAFVVEQVHRMEDHLDGACFEQPFSDQVGGFLGRALHGKERKFCVRGRHGGFRSGRSFGRIGHIGIRQAIQVAGIDQGIQFREEILLGVIFGCIA